jgi:hypothetical protein
MFKKYKRLYNFKHKNRQANVWAPYEIKEDSESEGDQQEVDMEWGAFTDQVEEIAKEELKKQESLEGGQQQQPSGGGEKKAAASETAPK